MIRAVAEFQEVGPHWAYGLVAAFGNWGLAMLGAPMLAANPVQCAEAMESCRTGHRLSGKLLGDWR